MEKLNKKYKKLKSLLYDEFNNDYIDYDDVVYNGKEKEYSGIIDIAGDCKVFVNLDNNSCMLSFVDISFDIHYTTDDIKELCEKLDNISSILS